MKIITISLIGFNHPIQANWSYQIFKIDLINTNEKFCMSHTVKSTFGGNDRLQNIVEDKLKYTIIETKQVYTSTGSQKITGVSKLLDIESKEVYSLIEEFLTK